MSSGPPRHRPPGSPETQPSDRLPLSAARSQEIIFPISLTARSVPPGRNGSTSSAGTLASTMGVTPREVCDRLASYGFQPPDASVLGEKVDRDDLAMLSTDSTGTGPGTWLNEDEPVPLIHLLDAAKHLNRSPDDIARRLAELGMNSRSLEELVEDALKLVPWAEAESEP